MDFQRAGDGQGHINHFGYTPARDLGIGTSFNLFNLGCPRNILYTLWNSNLDRKITQTFNIFESQYELLARQMLLLAIALDKFNYSLKEKVFTFMEVYGNSHVRSGTISNGKAEIF